MYRVTCTSILCSRIKYISKQGFGLSGSFRSFALCYAHLYFLTIRKLCYLLSRRFNKKYFVNYGHISVTLVRICYTLNESDQRSDWPAQINQLIKSAERAIVSHSINVKQINLIFTFLLLYTKLTGNANVTPLVSRVCRRSVYRLLFYKKPQIISNSSVTNICIFFDIRNHNF